jgi:hypothetical protein
MKDIHSAGSELHESELDGVMGGVSREIAELFDALQRDQDCVPAFLQEP